MATIAQHVPVPQDYRVTRILTANVATGETCAVPNMVMTVPEIQGTVDNRELSGTLDVRCDACGESVADCPELKGQLTGVPWAWSWESKVD